MSQSFTEKFFLEDLAVKIERIMRSKQLTRQELADKMGWSRDRIDRLISNQLGGEELELGHVAEIFMHLGVSVKIGLEKP